MVYCQLIYQPLGTVQGGELVCRRRNPTQDDSAVAPRATAQLKSVLAGRINELLDAQGIRQDAAARRLRIGQSKISQIRNYKLRGVSLERLMQALVALDERLEIIVRFSNRDH